MLRLPTFGSAKAVQALMNAADKSFALKQSAAISPTSHDKFVVIQCAFDPSIVGGADWLGVLGELAWVATAKRK